MSDSLEASMMKRIGELKAENARLKAECQARQAENSVLAVECDSLKAEVERLTSENKSLQTKATNIYNAMVVRCKVEEITHKANADSIISQGMMSEAMKLMEESVAIREQVERLTKAGDCLVIHLEACYRAEGYDPKDCDMIDNWNAAKKGAAS